MFRVIIPEGELECSRYEPMDSGVELYTDADELLAFVPYENLHVILNDEVHESDEDDEMSVM